jgi:hypothetical protein
MAMTLFVHRKTIRYTDYGDPLGSTTGIAWSSDGDPQNATGFERGKTIEDVRRKAAPYGDLIEIVEGPAIEITHDMNPHGLI